MMSTPADPRCLLQKMLEESKAKYGDFETNVLSKEESCSSPVVEAVQGAQSEDGDFSEVSLSYSYSEGMLRDTVCTPCLDSTQGARVSKSVCVGNLGLDAQVSKSVCVDPVMSWKNIDIGKGSHAASRTNCDKSEEVSKVASSIGAGHAPECGSTAECDRAKTADSDVPVLGVGAEVPVLKRVGPGLAWRNIVCGQSSPDPSISGGDRSGKLKEVESKPGARSNVQLN